MEDDPVAGVASRGPGPARAGEQDGSLPPAHLPLLLDSQVSTQEFAAATAARGSQEAEAPVLSEEVPGSEDLFGSDAEPSGPGKPSSADAKPAAELGAELGEVEELDEQVLFGSEDEGPAIDEKALFGSDEEGADAPPMPKSSTPTVEQPPEPSEGTEMDERDIFGDVSDLDDEPERVDEVTVVRRPEPSHDRVFMSLRLPNVLSVETRSFRRERVPNTLLEGFQELKNSRGQQVLKLFNPENCIRWRFKKDTNGEVLTDEDGRPQYESNTRLVEWEDGSKTLYVGKEVFNVSSISEQVYIFEENSSDILQCHGSTRTRLVATPQNLSSATHQALKRAQYRKFEPTRRSLLQTTEDQVAIQELQEIALATKKRQEKRGQNQLEQGGETLTAAYLEDGVVPAGGVSVADLKRQIKKQKT